MDYFQEVLVGNDQPQSDQSIDPQQAGTSP